MQGWELSHPYFKERGDSTNRNFKKLAKDFYAVDFNFLEAGYIDGFSYAGNPKEDLLATTSDGKFLINKAIDGYEKSVQLITWVMSMTDRQLKSEHGFYDFIRKFIPNVRKLNNAKLAVFITNNSLSSIEYDFEEIRQWEIKRRTKKKSLI